MAETGTIGVAINKAQPRLVSIAPPVHIAILPVGRLYPVYEDVIEQVFGKEDAIPSQFCLITGPSSTADIRAVQFNGMHGPVKIFCNIHHGRRIAWGRKNRTGGAGREKSDGSGKTDGTTTRKGC